MSKIVTILFTVIATATSLTTPMKAQAPPDPAAESPHKFTANIGAYSDYRFRGLSQTMQSPAVQGGFDYSHSSGFYLGNWDSNISSAVYPNGNLEMDFYGGYKVTSGAFGLDAGAIYYFYPSTKATLINPASNQVKKDTRVDNTELYVSGNWKWFSLKYSHAISDFFDTPDTRNSWYVDFTAAYTIGRNWGIAGHIGRQEVQNLDIASYTDWRIGVTKEIRGFVFGLDYIDTNARDALYRYADAGKSMNIGRAGAVGYLKRSF